MNTNYTQQIMMADDHAVLRDGLAVLINTFDAFRVIGVADNGEELLKQMDAGTIPDIVLLDISMPRMDGYETAGRLKQNYPQVKVVILTMFDSEIAFIRLLQTGVKGFIKKDIQPALFRVALNEVVANGYYYSNSVAGKLAALFHNATSINANIARTILSETEIEFLKYASTDLTYKEIAVVMKLTPRSVDSYRDGLFEKLDAKSRVGLVIYAVKNGIVTF